MAVARLLAISALIHAPGYVASFVSSTQSISVTSRTAVNSRVKRHHRPRPMSSIADDTCVVQRLPEEESKVDAKKSYLDDGFIFGLEGSGLERPKGKVASLVVEGDTLETTPAQAATVVATLGSHSLFALNSIGEICENNGRDVAATALQTVILLWSSWVLADFGSGVFHWSVDNYGNGRTPLMGSIIAAFQGHHSAPWTITERGFYNNVYKLCIPFGIATVGSIYLISGPAITLFFASFCALEILSQEMHKWSHMTKKEVPAFVNTLQDMGLTVGRKSHAKHHMAPYDGNYCIVSGACNDALDRSGFFRWMELQVYKATGVESNAWKLDSALRERTLAGNFGLVDVGIKQ